jgi:hypothetical protein
VKAAHLYLYLVGIVRLLHAWDDTTSAEKKASGAPGRNSDLPETGTPSETRGPPARPVTLEPVDIQQFERAFLDLPQLRYSIIFRGYIQSQ